MNLLGLSVSLTLFVLVHCQEGSQPQGYCRYKLEEIDRTLNLALNSSGDVRKFVVNCLAHNGTYAQFLSVSVYRDNANDSMRYDFQCVGGATLKLTLSEFVSNVSNFACASCDFTMKEPCVGRCGELCGSCTVDNTSNCLTCRYLQKRVEHKHNGTCLDNSSCEIQSFTPTEGGCVCDGYLQLHNDKSDPWPQYLLPNEEHTYKCVDVCERPNVIREEGGICEVCGVEKCVHCVKGKCGRCVYGYNKMVNEETGHIECITDAEFNLRDLTEKLMHKQEEEEEAKEDTGLLLSILLPIFCILTLLVCVGMSVFTHYWYPYIKQDGNKRSKTKPTEEEQLTVWRPRPTIRYR